MDAKENGDGATTLTRMEACARQQLDWMHSEGFEPDVIEAQEAIVELLGRLIAVERELPIADLR